MFSTRLKPTNDIFECLLICDTSDSVKGCFVDRCYPADYPYDAYAKQLIEFAFPCEHKSTLSEEYTLVFTDVGGKLEFAVCLYLPMSGYFLCFRSFMPLFELLHNVLLFISQHLLSTLTSNGKLESLLKWLKTPNRSDSEWQNLFISLPDSRSHPYYHRHILEYYSALSINNWIVIFESLLMENSIIFYSNRLQRLSSCIMASLSLIYPLVWVHLVYPILPATCIDYLGCPTPFVAGVHTCMVNKIKENLTPGIRLVDLDNDTIYTMEQPEFCLPDVIREWLIRRCNMSHKSILRHHKTAKDLSTTAAAYLSEPYMEVTAILLGGYRDALRQYLTVSSVPVSSTLPTSGQWRFDSTVFVSSRGRECHQYLRRLLQSQMVVQFIQSRLALLNSDSGMIPPDDFEDCISRLKLTPRTNLAEFLNPHRRFGRLADKFTDLKRKAREQNQRLLSSFQKSIPQMKGRLSIIAQSCKKSNPLQSDSIETSSDDSLSSSDSVDTKITEHEHPVPTTSVNNETTKVVLRPVDGTLQYFASDGDSKQLQTERSRRSLVTSILCEIRDVPPDWLKPPTVQPDMAYCSSSTESNTVTSGNGNAFMQRVSSVPYQHTNVPRNTYHNDTSDVLPTFDPYWAKAPKPTVTASDALSQFLRQLDPLLAHSDETNLLQ